MAGGRAILCALVVGSLGVDGNVHGQGTIHHTAGDLALLVHLTQLLGIHGAGHLGVDDLNGGQRSNLGAGNAAGMGHGNSILDDMHFIFQRWVGHKGNIGQEKQLLDALDLKDGHMGQGLAGAQADLLVQHTLQEGLGVQQALHVHIGHAVMRQLDSLQRGLHLVGLVDDLIVGKVDVQLCRDLADGSLVTHQNGIGNALLMGGVNSLQNRIVLSGGDSQLLLAAGFYFRDQVLKIHLTAPRFFQSGRGSLKKAPYVKIITLYAPWVKRGKGSGVSKNNFSVWRAVPIKSVGNRPILQKADRFLINFALTKP